MSEVKIIKGKTKDGKWIELNDRYFNLQEFTAVKIYEIISKKKFKKYLTPCGMRYQTILKKLKQN